jgi:hypothetical protein
VRFRLARARRHDANPFKVGQREMASLAAMIEVIADMPRGTLGFRATGRIDVEEYKRILIPPLQSAVEAGRVRLLFQVGPDFERFDAATMWADVKSSVDLGVRHREAWERFAMVTDIEWITRTTQLFAWAVPGELRLFPFDGAEDAKAWLVARASGS